MKYSTVFHLVSDVSQKKSISCVLIGGFAVNYYKVTRQTADIDFLITREDFEKIYPELEKEGYKKEYFEETFTRLKSDSMYLMDLDYMFVDKETLDKISRDAKELTIAKQKFIVPSLEHLIALKLHSIKNQPKLRKIKDLPDIVNLIKINNVDVKTDDFRKICLQYGTPELYNEILKGT